MLERLPLWCFRLALITTTLNSIAVMAALSHRFGLVSDGQGGYFVVNTYLVAAALGFSLLALLFSIISGKWIAWLVVGNIGLFLLGCISMLSNGR